MSGFRYANMLKRCGVTIFCDNVPILNLIALNTLYLTGHQYTGLSAAYHINIFYFA